MKPVVLITRPEEEARALFPVIESLGLTPVAEPLFSFEFFPPASTVKPAAIVATSPQAFAQNLQMEWSDLPVFVMGEVSAERARAAGFTNILSSGGDFTRLTALIAEKVPAGADILYLRGEIIRHDLRNALPLHRVTEDVVYKTIPVSRLSEQGQALLKQDKITVVTLFSPRSAEIFTQVVHQAGLETACSRIKVLCLSVAVLESAQGLPWHSGSVAATSDRSGMADALKNLR